MRVRSWSKFLILFLLVGAALLQHDWRGDEPAAPPSAPALPAPPPDVARPADGLPPEAHETLARIRAGGPFPHRQDGGTFHNREGRLPGRPRGHYREYTVETPGARDRGARRIVAGGDPPTDFFYTDDHYRSFRRLAPRP
jgi:guanyl-specific ribonuclease Sa